MRLEPHSTNEIHQICITLKSFPFYNSSNKEIYEKNFIFGILIIYAFIKIMQ